jgi:hypothetical protein
MIIFNGIKYNNNKNKIAYLLFTNEQKQFIEIPIDFITADRINKYLNKLSKTNNLIQESVEDQE